MSLTVPQEALLKTLSVMTRADTNIQQIEVEAVQKIINDELGLSVTSAQVHMAANSEFIERREIDKYLKSVSKQLEQTDKITIVRCLKNIILSDGQAHSREIDMFNKVVDVLKLTPAELVLM
ncbi:MAG: TerB family tellurite resistance protein [Kordiimonadaceae bacterium]|jgi:uncharacterized tellurite resistance protein B-like protein|nr:TerB family tellurite resistance protein [Kordiimonadaceae bacterium]MBT6036949.1 TerB family tellurite resistance protein [Kordiimonadaceae bacterium]MBT6330010.1 TerB family tellurite resistance protein [Kordiimonadaceae bacterium]MBT7583476.1 TerB family tellurite resistance protein [Kordiimonadaceae bacterium]